MHLLSKIERIKKKGFYEVDRIIYRLLEGKPKIIIYVKRISMQKYKRRFTDKEQGRTVYTTSRMTMR